MMLTRLRYKHRLEFCDGVLQYARRDPHTRAQEERVNVLRVALQEFLDLRARARRVAALEAYLAEAVARARVVRPVLVVDDLLVDAGGGVEAPDRSVVVREARATVGLVPVELRPGLVSLLGL